MPFEIWFVLSPSSRRLIAAGAVLLVAVVAAIGLTLWDMHNRALQDVSQNVSKLGIAIAEQTSRSIQAADLVLQEIRTGIMASGADTPERFKTILQTKSIHDILARKDDTLPQANAFIIAGADGVQVNTSRAWPVPALDLADRLYYTYFRDHDDRNPYISGPMQNRVDGRWTIYIVRRINGPSGNFLGIVFGALDLDYFADFYQTLTAGTATNVVLFHRDGRVLASSPFHAPVGALVNDNQQWRQAVDRGQQATITSQGLLHAERRIIAVQPLRDYPLVVDVGISQWASLAEWRRAAILFAVGTGSAVLCVTLLLRALSLQLRRLERQAGELSASQKRLAAESGALSTTLEHMNQGIVMLDSDHKLVVVNERAVQMLDLPTELLGSPIHFSEVIAARQERSEAGNPDSDVWIDASDLSNPSPVFERIRPDGRTLEIQTVHLQTGGMVRTYTDVTERRRSEAQVKYFAHHDDMTKLVNRFVFQERLQQAIDLADRTRRSVAVLYLDLDRFKLVNDTKGHATGDKLLVQVAERLRSVTREVDTVARMGGDEFAIIQPLLEQPNSSLRLAERLLTLIKQPFIIDGAQCSIGLSIGIAHYPDHAECASDLSRNADTALYRAKAEGRGAARLFEKEMDERQQELFMIEQDLRQALDLDQFYLEYQPVVDLASNRITGCEALLRWNHPQRGVINPVDFIGLAEKSGLIVSIGLWALEVACSQAARWPATVRIAVNLSPVQFNQDDLIEKIVEILDRTHLPAERLILEVTEGLVLEESRAVLCTMSQLRAMGVRLSLDDFGTAHAGLSYLRRFPFDAIKIDKSFVRDIVSEPEAEAIVAAMLQVGAALKLNVVAEGVETDAQLAQLRRMRCQRVQGFLTGRPQSAADLRTLFSTFGTMLPSLAEAEID